MDQESNLAKHKTWSWAKVSHANTDHWINKYPIKTKLLYWNTQFRYTEYKYNNQFLHHITYTAIWTVVSFLRSCGFGALTSDCWLQSSVTLYHIILYIIYHIILIRRFRADLIQWVSVSFYEYIFCV